MGNKLIVNNSVAIPSNYGAPNRRLIMQPYIMDCTTEEIVSYMDPTVMDGPEYGLTQDRRMATTSGTTNWLPISIPAANWMPHASTWTSMTRYPYPTSDAFTVYCPKLL